MSNAFVDLIVGFKAVQFEQVHLRLGIEGFGYHGDTVGADPDLLGYLELLQEIPRQEVWVRLQPYQKSQKCHLWYYPQPLGRL